MRNKDGVGLNGQIPHDRLQFIAGFLDRVIGKSFTYLIAYVSTFFLFFGLAVDLALANLPRDLHRKIFGKSPTDIGHAARFQNAPNLRESRLFIVPERIRPARDGYIYLIIAQGHPLGIRKNRTYLAPNSGFLRFPKEIGENGRIDIQIDPVHFRRTLTELDH